MAGSHIVVPTGHHEGHGPLNVRMSRLKSSLRLLGPQKNTRVQWARVSMGPTLHPCQGRPLSWVVQCIGIPAMENRAPTPARSRALSIVSILWASKSCRGVRSPAEGLMGDLILGASSDKRKAAASIRCRPRSWSLPLIVDIATSVLPVPMRESHFIEPL
jgi:hypothetical protein